MRTFSLDLKFSVSQSHRFDGMNPPAIKEQLLSSKMGTLALQGFLVISKPMMTWRRHHYAKPANWQRRTYRQKVRWRCRHPDPQVDYAGLVDKRKVREFAKSLLPVPQHIACVRIPAEIEKLALPDSFVMKATHGWNMHALVRDGKVTRHSCDKTDEGKKATGANLSRIASGWFKSKENLLLRAREWQYRGLEPGILFEQIIDVEYELELFLFHGQYRIAMIHLRKPGENGPVSDGYLLYDQYWNRLEPGSHKDAKLYNHSSPGVPPPDPGLLSALEAICGHIDHVRADFLVSAGTAYLIELTFTHNAGYPSLLGPYEEGLGRAWR